MIKDLRNNKSLKTLVFYQDLYNYIGRNNTVTIEKMCKFFKKERQAIQLSLNIMRDLWAPLYYDNRTWWKVVDNDYTMNYSIDNLRVLVWVIKY